MGICPNCGCRPMGKILIRCDICIEKYKSNLKKRYHANPAKDRKRNIETKKRLKKEGRCYNCGRHLTDLDRGKEKCFICREWRGDRWN